MDDERKLEAVKMLTEAAELARIATAKKERYDEWLQQEQDAGGVHPNGCWWCARHHPSPQCWYREIPEE